MSKAILFDLGGVLIQWDPRRHYRTLFSSEADMEYFLAEVCTGEWNRTIDAGKPFREAVAERQALWPEFAGLIGQWQSCWAAMLGDAVPGTVDVFRDLKGQGLKVCALSNWSAETFPIARERFEFLSWFDRIVVSGEVGLAKPDPAIFTLAMELCGLVAEETIFIDDVIENVETARRVGMDALLFRNAEELRIDLTARGLLA